MFKITPTISRPNSDAVFQLLQVVFSTTSPPEGTETLPSDWPNMLMVIFKKKGQTKQNSMEHILKQVKLQVNNTCVKGQNCIELLSFLQAFAKHQLLFNHTQTHPRTQFTRNSTFPTQHMEATGESCPGS